MKFRKRQRVTLAGSQSPNPVQGTVRAVFKEGWVTVRWDNGGWSTVRDVALIPGWYFQ